MYYPPHPPRARLVRYTHSVSLQPHPSPIRIISHFFPSFHQNKRKYQSIFHFLSSLLQFFELLNPLPNITDYCRNPLHLSPINVILHSSHTNIYVWRLRIKYPWIIHLIFFLGKLHTLYEFWTNNFTFHPFL